MKKNKKKEKKNLLLRIAICATVDELACSIWKYFAMTHRPFIHKTMALKSNNFFLSTEPHRNFMIFNFIFCNQNEKKPKSSLAQIKSFNFLFTEKENENKFTKFIVTLGGSFYGAQAMP